MIEFHRFAPRSILRPSLVGALCAVGGFADSYAARAELVFVDAIFDDSVGGDADGLAGALLPGISPDGRHVYVPGGSEVPGIGGDELAILTRNAATGKLTYSGLVVNGEDSVTGLDGPFGAAVSPDGAHVYVVALNDNAVVAFARDAETGALDFVHALIDGVSGVDGLDGAQALAISPDGEHVYVTASGEDKLAVFSRNAGSGALSFVEVEQNGVAGVTGLLSPAGVAVSPDGENVYVCGFGGDALLTFVRNPTSGALLHADTLLDTDEGIDGLDHPAFLAVSPDGEHVYVAAQDDDSVAAFERSGAFGELAFVQVLKNGVDVPSGLDVAADVAITPDGSTVYATGAMSDAVVELDRDDATGELTYVRAAFDGVGGVDGINGAIGVAVAPDGKHLYVTGFEEFAVAAFATLPLVFADDFETGDPSAWSGVVG